MKKSDETNGYLVLIKVYYDVNGDAQADIYPDDKPGLRVYSNSVTDGDFEFQRGPDKVKFEFIDLTNETDRECSIIFDKSWQNIVEDAPFKLTLKNNESSYIQILGSTTDRHYLNYTVNIKGILRSVAPPKMIIKNG